MKKILLILIILNSFIAHSQNKILFSYDTAGNQIIRELCINCQTAGKSPVDIVKENPAEEDMLKFFPEDKISYYPNPVKENLHLAWELVNDKSVSSIQVYSLNGQLLKSFNSLENSTIHIISFQDFPTGAYTLLMLYSNGEKKSIKIIKQ